MPISTITLINLEIELSTLKPLFRRAFVVLCASEAHVPTSFINQVHKLLIE
jgi:hypothetical protein